MLLKTHGAYTRALILRARAFRIHYFSGPFSAPFLDTFWVPKMEAKWEPKWDPQQHKNRICRILCPTLGAQGPKVISRLKFACAVAPARARVQPVGGDVFDEGTRLRKARVATSSQPWEAGSTAQTSVARPWELDQHSIISIVCAPGRGLGQPR